MRIVTFFSLFLAAGLALAAQSFDAASIRVVRQGEFSGLPIGLQPGRVVVNGATVHGIVAAAFGVPTDRIVEGPD